MKTVEEKVQTSVEQTTEAMKKSYYQRAIPEPHMEIADLVMLNAKKLKANSQHESSPHDCMALLKDSKKRREGVETRYPWWRENSPWI